MISHGLQIDGLMSLEYSKPKDKDPVVVLALGFGICGQPIETSRRKNKAPAVVFIGGFSPECDN